MEFNTILFDLDGTLTDPKIGITKSIQYALAKFDIEVKDLDELEPFIGPPLNQSFKEFYSFDEVQTKEAVSFYREYFSEKGLYENQLYDGIVDLLEELTKQNKQLYVATSKPTFFAEKILEHFEMKKYFHYIGGSNLDGTRQDKAEVIQHVIEQENLDIDDIVMIGDRKHDLIGAEKNGVASIGVGYGYGSKQELTDCKPTYYVETVKELLEVLAS
ncbi:HAD family hydrolase [Chengkuizengella axinellae]|uniref:HAD family hydrolase n=1 Tax=Chengkuizengella axinellae TaxID=3064388 RepID=A0ABT9IU11_9BACL|nr:HAD family hydrolase [Chengkuizengella sp. 2205SS18-9]MDP5272836.1 HAD family hydrolase [Chengkuizengella sp. 2205SS18-9]